MNRPHRKLFSSRLDSFSGVTAFILLAMLGMKTLSQAGELPDPADHLPPNIQRLTWFGERADWRHDGERFVFLNRAYGDVYEYDLKTGRILPCTDHFKHHGFVRAHYLANGDLLLSGPQTTFDRTDPKARQQARDASELLVLDKSFTKPPVALGIQCNEGPAVSRKSMKIAWTHGHQDHISTGEIVMEGASPELMKPVLKNRQLVLKTQDFPEGERPRQWIETQNFVPGNENLLTVTAYEIQNTTNTETYLLDLNSGKLTNLSQTADRYEECEGVFPDGGWTLVESSEFLNVRWPLVDLYKLALDGSGTRQRLTHFTDFKGWKGAEGVVSDDGRFLLFQNGKSGQESGVGFGIFLMKLDDQPR